MNEKDRGQLLRMAGNIACGLVMTRDTAEYIAERSAKIALLTLQAVDKLIDEQATKED